MLELVIFSKFNYLSLHNTVLSNNWVYSEKHDQNSFLFKV